MDNKPINLDQFLEMEAKEGAQLLAIIEKDSNKPEHVRITPWQGEGCDCASGLSIPRKLVASVEKTGNSHQCCGGNHAVVKVTFAKDAAIPLVEAFTHLAKTLAVTHRSSYGVPLARRNQDVYAWYPADEMSWTYKAEGRPSLYPLCVVAGYRRVWHGPILDKDGRTVRTAYWEWVPYYENRITGQPCRE